MPQLLTQCQYTSFSTNFKTSSFGHSKDYEKPEPTPMEELPPDEWFDIEKEGGRKLYDLRAHNPDAIPNYPKVNTKTYFLGQHILIDERRPSHSAYVRIVNKHGQVWHLFDAARYPLGRMAGKIASYITGKYRPDWQERLSLELGDNVVVVNAANIKMTGRKRQQKLYRWHTGYAGGLKTRTFKEMQETHPERQIIQAVRGMMNSNPTRKRILEKRLWIYPGQNHNQTRQGLPQFQVLPYEDPNVLADHIIDDSWKVVHSNTGEVAEELRETVGEENIDLKPLEEVQGMVSANRPGYTFKSNKNTKAMKKHHNKERKLLRRYKEYK